MSKYSKAAIAFVYRSSLYPCSRPSRSWCIWRRLTQFESNLGKDAMTDVPDEETIQARCTDRVFQRGQNYRAEKRIERVGRFGDVVTAAVEGSELYDVTVELSESTVAAECTCPYDGPGDCKHVVAVLLEIAGDLPADERTMIERILQKRSEDELRAFVTDALAQDPALRDRFFARFGEVGKSLEAYRSDVDRLFDQHTDDYPVVVDAIDFTRLFDIAELYQARDRPLEAATVYRALFEGIDEHLHLVDAAYDHYAKAFQAALTEYVDCVSIAEIDPETFESYAGVLAERASTGSEVHREQFLNALEELEHRRNS